MAAEQRYKMTFSPQFVLKVSHSGSLFLEVVVEDDMRAHWEEEASNMTLFLYDFESCKDSHPRGDKAMTKKNALSGPVVAHPTSNRQSDWGKTRSVQLEVADPHPVPDREYIVAAHRWDPVGKDPVFFTITAWYMPHAPVALSNSSITLSHATTYEYSRSTNQKLVKVDFDDLLPFQQDLSQSYF